MPNGGNGPELNDARTVTVDEAWLVGDGADGAFKDVAFAPGHDGDARRRCRPRVALA